MASEEYVGKISDAQCLELALLAYQDSDEGIYENQTLEKYVNSYSPADLNTLLSSGNQKDQDLGKMIQSLQLEMEKEDSPMKHLEIREYDQASQINSTYEAVMAVDRGQSAEVKGVTDRIKARTAAIAITP